MSINYTATISMNYTTQAFPSRTPKAYYPILSMSLNTDAWINSVI